MRVRIPKRNQGFVTNNSKESKGTGVERDLVTIQGGEYVLQKNFMETEPGTGKHSGAGTVTNRR